MAQACYPFFLAGSWGVVEVILFFCFLGYPLNPAYLVFGCVVAGVAGVLVQRPLDIVFWNCWGRDVAHWPSPHSSCASTLERSLVLLFRFSFLEGVFGQVSAQFLCKRRFCRSCGKGLPLVQMHPEGYHSVFEQ